MLHWIVHLGAIANFGYAIYWDVYILKLPTQRSFGGQWKYLTFWNLWIQLIYFSISLLNSLFGSNAKEKAKASRLQRLRDYFFSTLAFPIGLFVGIIFWSLWHIDRELVFPKAFDKFFPNYINHMMHTTVLPAQLLELILLYHIYPSKLKGMLTTILFCMTYLSWTLVVAHYGGIWVYPIFAVLDPVPRAAFMIFCSMMGAMLFLGGALFNSVIWGGDSDASAMKAKDEPLQYSSIHQQQSGGVTTRSKAKKPKKTD